MEQQQLVLVVEGLVFMGETLALVLVVLAAAEAAEMAHTTNQVDQMEYQELTTQALVLVVQQRLVI
jgi:hypothetical protein